jgi:NADP-dependent 3-hydroxy acid dehydrogenase YdfG
MSIEQQTNTLLKGQVAVVTGASSGIGESIAEELVRRGVHVALSARRQERLEAVAQRLRGAGYGEVLTLSGDVRKPQHVQDLVNGAVKRWGRLDVVVANAGFGYRSPIADGDVERWKELLDTNVYGVLLTLKYGVRALLDQGGGHGHVFLISSVAGRVVTAGGGVYSGSKFAVNAIGEALRQEVGLDGIRVTLIEPGAVTTEFAEVAGYSAEVRANIKQTEPLAPKDIANVLIYALEQPRHVNVADFLVYPTRQTGLSFLAPKK